MTTTLRITPFRFVVTSLLAAATLCGGGAALATEAHVPLAAATTISTSGSYVLTRDITASGTPLVVSAGTVTIDLNGHTLATTGSASVLVVNGPANLTLRNGRLYGGYRGLDLQPSAAGSRVAVSRVEFENHSQAIDATDAGELVVEDCTIHDVSTALVATANTVATLVRVARNDVRSITGVVLSAPGASMRGNVEDNILRLAEGNGVLISGVTRALSVARNKIAGANYGVVVSGAGGHVVASNVISQSIVAGIRIAADNCVVFHNTVVAGAAQGIDVASAGNLIDANLVNANLGVGLHFEATSLSCVYRNNAVRGNGLANYADDTFEGNTNAGGNQ